MDATAKATDLLASDAITSARAALQAQQALDAAQQPDEQAAASRLKLVMDTLRVESAAAVLDEALEMRHLSRKAPRAVPLLQAVADAGMVDGVSKDNSTHAALTLGTMYLRGENITRDVRLAMRYLQRAADAGSPDAQHALGVLHSTGLATPPDPPLAATYYHFAAEGGSTWAQLTLGYRHLMGVAAPKVMIAQPVAPPAPPSPA